MSSSSFNDLVDFYEMLIDWPKRLANEGPFYRHWFNEVSAKRVLDVACGTGQHAKMFQQWGLTVEASDLSPEMIAHAKSNCGEDERLRWVVRRFDDHVDINDNDYFDAALCVGNSLALAPDSETVERAIGRMFAAVRPGGLVIVHVLNLWCLAEGPCVWQKCKKARLGEKSFSPMPTATTRVLDDSATSPVAKSSKVPVGFERDEKEGLLILKGIHRSNSLGYVEFLVASLAEGKLLHHESVPFLGLEASQLECYAQKAGAKTIHFFGDYRQRPYNREKSTDLIAVAQKN
jgi:SAM-dependent methyltransferase